MVAGPDIISRGFVYVRESEDLMDEAKEIVKDVLRDCEKKGICDWATMKSNIRDGLRSFLYEKTKKTNDITNNNGNIKKLDDNVECNCLSKKCCVDFLKLNSRI